MKDKKSILKEPAELEKAWELVKLDLLQKLESNQAKETNEFTKALGIDELYNDNNESSHDTLMECIMQMCLTTNKTDELEIAVKFADSFSEFVFVVWAHFQTKEKFHNTMNRLLNG